MPKLPNIPYTAEENRLILKYPQGKSIKLKALKRRTPGAIKGQRFKLLHPELYQRGNGKPHHWPPDDVKKLRTHFPIENQRQLMKRFPDRTYANIAFKARRLGIKKRYTGPPKHCRTDGHYELFDQIKMRAKQDGFTIKALDEALGLNRYFRQNCTSRKSLDLKKVLKAVEFFGGKFVIDWQDR